MSETNPSETNRKEDNNTNNDEKEKTGEVETEPSSNNIHDESNKSKDDEKETKATSKKRKKPECGSEPEPSNNNINDTTEKDSNKTKDDEKETKVTSEKRKKPKYRLGPERYKKIPVQDKVWRSSIFRVAKREGHMYSEQDTRLLVFRFLGLMRVLDEDQDQNGAESNTDDDDEECSRAAKDVRLTILRTPPGVEVAEIVPEREQGNDRVAECTIQYGSLQEDDDGNEVLIPNGFITGIYRRQNEKIGTDFQLVLESDTPFRIKRFEVEFLN